MTTIEALILGFIQGITEFLPVSSSGHLVVTQRLFGLKDIPILYNVFLHLATLLAVVIFFRKQIIDLVCVLFRWIFRKPVPNKNGEQGSLLQAAQMIEEKAKRQMIISLILATIVTGCMGLGISPMLPDFPIMYVYVGFICTAFILLVSARIKPKAKKSDKVTLVTPLQGLFIGFMQGVGVFPGISRSGSTIAGAMFAGVDRNIAGEFSFLLSIPAILGAFLLELKDLDGVASTIGTVPILAGCAAAFISGLFCLAFLMKLIKKGKLEYFAYYLIPLAVIGLLFFR